MSKTIHVLYKQVGKTMVERTITNTLEECQKLVDGPIEVVALMPDVLLILNEEGRIRGLAPNPFAGRPYVGDWFICGSHGVNFADVPRAYVKIVKQFMTVLPEKKGGE